MVEEVAELVQESERDTSPDPRDAQVNRVAEAEAVRPGLGDGRGRPDRHRLEIGMQTVQPRRGRECMVELARQRTAAR